MYLMMFFAGEHSNTHSGSINSSQSDITVFVLVEAVTVIAYTGIADGTRDLISASLPEHF